MPELQCLAGQHQHVDGGYPHCSGRPWLALPLANAPSRSETSVGSLAWRPQHYRQNFVWRLWEGLQVDASALLVVTPPPVEPGKMGQEHGERLRGRSRGGLVIGIDETSERRRAAKIAAKGIYRCPGELNRCTRRSRWRVGWCEFSTRLLRYRCCRCSTMGRLSRLAAP
jgi:hypothetical protein